MRLRQPQKIVSASIETRLEKCGSFAAKTCTGLYLKGKEREIKLTLALLVLGVVADNENLAFSLDYLALVAHFLY